MRSDRGEEVSDPPIPEAAQLNHAVMEYKRIFKEVLDNRPSGMRLKLSRALGKNRSFISQIGNPAYPTPIPAQHLKTIFEVCHFPPETKAIFLKAYENAHPSRMGSPQEPPEERMLQLRVPDLGSKARNDQFDALLNEIALRLTLMLQVEKEVVK